MQEQTTTTSFFRFPSRRFPLLPILVWLIANPLNAQPLFSDYVDDGIDSALSLIAMTRYDLGMRADATGTDIHRLSTITRLFSFPLESFDITDSLSRTALSGLDVPQLYLRQVGALLDLRPTFPEPERIVVRDREIELFGRFDINTLNYTEQMILRKFLGLAIATDVILTKQKGEIDSGAFARLVAYSDTLLLQSEDDAETDVITMRYGERYALGRAKRFFNEDVASVDFTKMLSPGVAMYTQALDEASRMRNEVPSYGTSVRTGVWQTPLGLIAIGGAGDDIYTGEFFCIIDIGGDDIYRSVSRTKEQAAANGTSLIIDYNGDDTYLGEDYAFGGSLFGASVVIDYEGDDSYTARNFSIGTGFFGVGIVHDEAGHDRYDGGTAVQGAGIFGIGLLVDGRGNDNYYAHLTSQGFGYTRGFGAIIEHGGNDQYISASPYQDFLRYDDHFESFCQGASLGYRPVASGGIGIVVDGTGSDVYISDIYGQGTAYWYGLGAIVDRKGNDTYSSYQYAQGSGVHLAFGVLSDLDGNDNYIAHGVSQGCGHDIAFGGLFDKRGDDNYVVESLSLGGGNANAVSLFVDAGGNDGYIARHENTLGYSDMRRSYGMIGIFLDLDGTDFYGTSRGGNDSLWLGSSYGIGLDATMKPEEITLAEREEPKKSPEEIERELATTMEELFIQGSAAPQKYQYLVEPALKRLEAGADSTIPFLLSMLDSEHPREQLALRVLLPRIGARLTPMLIDTIRQGSRSRVGMAIYILGVMKDSTAAAVIGEQLSRPEWRIRSSAAEALLSMNPIGARDALRTALNDSIDLVRARVARAFARVGDADDLRLLIPLLNDSSQIVRYQIPHGLNDRGLNTDSIARGFFVSTLLDPPAGYAYRVLYPFAKNITTPIERERIVSHLIRHRSATRRADAVRLVLEWNDPALLRTVLARRDEEKASEVLYLLYQAEAKLNNL